MRRTLFSTLALLLLGATVAGAQEGQEGQQMTPEMMEAYARLAQPGEPHERLARSVGDWNVAMSMYPGPGAPAMQVNGTMSAQPMLGGRFVEEVWSAEMMGQPFEGIGIQGYDNQKEIYTTVWMDSMGTYSMFFEGKCANDDCSAIERSAQVTDPMSGQEITNRSLTTWVDDDTFTFVSWVAGPDGNEFKNMELTANRMVVE